MAYYLDKVLLFSCGIDSTYLAWKMLQREDIHLHHVSMRTVTPLWRHQDAQIHPILDYFKKQNFHFEYSDSVWEFNGSQPGFDSDVLLLAAQKICQNISNAYLKVYMGWNPSDMLRRPIAERAERSVTPNLWSALVASARNRHCIDDKLHFPLIEQGITKKEMIEEMPKELLDLTVSCRRGNNCGSCHACRDIAKAMS